MTQIIVGDTQNVKDKVTSLEVLEQINFFRSQERENLTRSELYTETGKVKQGYAELGHKTLLSIIRDEFSEEILSQELLLKSLPSTGGRPITIYELNLSQARQILLRESKYVRKAVLRWIEELEQALRGSQKQVPTSFREALLLAAEQQAIIEEQQKQLTEQAPKVAFTDAVLASQSSCLIGELAKIITQNGVEIGEKRLFKWMRTNGYLGSKGDRYNIPMQRYIEQGLFELKKGIRSGNNGVMHTTITTKVKPKGQLYFVNKFLNK